MSNHQYQEDRISKTRLRNSFIGSVIGIVLAMYIVGIFAFIVYISNTFIHSLSQNIEVELSFFSDIPEYDILQLEKHLKTKNYVQKTEFFSQKQNTEEAIELLGSDFTEIIDNPINATIILTMNPLYSSPQKLDSIAQILKRNTIVQDVTYPQIIVENIHQKIRPIQIAVFIVALILTLISFALIANSIRLAIYSKRFLIKSMLLVGAEKGFVRKPFIKTGFLQGLIGGLLSIILLGLTLYIGHRFYPDMFYINNLNEIGIILGGIFILSLLLTLIATLISVNKYIRIKTDNLF